MLLDDPAHIAIWASFRDPVAGEDCWRPGLFLPDLFGRGSRQVASNVARRGWRGERLKADARALCLARSWCLPA